MPPPSDFFDNVVKKYCRMCALELKQGVLIFGDEGKRLQISEKIRKTLSILILEEDSLPKKICTECCSSLEDYSRYKDTVLDAQEKLSSIVRNLERSRGKSQNNTQIQKEQQEPVSILQKALVSDDREEESGGNEPVSPAADVESSPVADLLEPMDLCDDESRKSRSPSPSPNKSAEGNLEKGKKKLSPIKLAMSTSTKEPEKLQESSDEWVLQCGICAHPTEDKDDLKKHHAENHDADKYPVPVYGCSYCPRISENYNALRMHIYRHLKEGTFKCNQCPKTFPVKDQLQRHWNATHNPVGKAFSCKVCGKRFTAKCSLVTHMTSKHPLQQEEGVADDAKTKDNDKTTVLQEEDHEIVDTVHSPLPSPPPSSPQQLETYQQDASGGGVESSLDKAAETTRPKDVSELNDGANGKKPRTDDLGVWKCAYCDKQFETSRGYELHVNTHIGKRFVCEHCDKSFTQKSSLTHHVTSQHSETSGQYKCDICSKEFSASKLLHRHKRRHAEPEAESKCTICSKVFRTLLHLKSHMKGHKSKKNYVCETCGKRFLNQHKLNVHENTHTGARTLKCPHCSYAARTEGPLYRHINRHRKKDKQVPVVSDSTATATIPSVTTFSSTSQQNIYSNNSTSTVQSNSFSRSNGSGTSSNNSYMIVPILEDLSTKSPQKQQVQVHAVPLSHFNSNNANPSSSHGQLQQQNSVSSEHSHQTNPSSSSSTNTNCGDNQQQTQIMHAHSSSHGGQSHQNQSNLSNFHNSHQSSSSSSWNNSNNFQSHSSSNGSNNTLDLVDCAIQHAFNNDGGVSSHNSPYQNQPSHNPNYSSQNQHQQHHAHCSPLHPSPSNAHSTTLFVSSAASLNSSNSSALTMLSGNSSRNHHLHSNSSSRQNEPMELSYKLQIESNDMPMELTKVFQRDPLELCVRQEFNQLMDLSARVNEGMNMSSTPLNMNNNNTISCVGLGNYHKELTDRELSFNDLSGAFRQPIDLIARVEDSSHDICSEGNLVDLSLRSTFGQDQSTFLRELIDLSSRPGDSFHGELNLTNKNSGNSQSSQSQSTHQSPNNKGHSGSHHHQGSLQNVNVIYHDSMFTL